MITVTKRFLFSAAHQLSEHRGKCRNLHGHNYEVEVTVAGPMHAHGPERGMVVDLDTLATISHSYCDLVDHKLLNDCVSYPTAEVLSEHVANYFQQFLGTSVKVSQVVVRETDNGWATWTV